MDRSLLMFKVAAMGPNKSRLYSGPPDFIRLNDHEWRFFAETTTPGCSNTATIFFITELSILEKLSSSVLISSSVFVLSQV